MASTAKFKRGVSLYSYQELFYRGEIDLRACMAAAAATGATGVEMLPDQMLPGYPSLTYNLSDAFIEAWKADLATYNLQPVTFDVYGETKLFKGQACDDQDLTRQLIEQFKTGRALGFAIMRITFHVPPSVIEALVPAAEDMGLKMAIEVHAPHRLNGAWVERTLEIAQRTGTRNLGIMPDFGTFCRAIPRLALEESRRHGVTEDVIAYLSDVYHEPVKPADIEDRVIALGGNAAAQWLAKRVEIGVWINDDPRLLAPLAPYIFHAHGKFYELTENLEEPEVRYDDIMAVLIEAGFEGYVSSEYEGQRLTQDIDPGYDEVEQVRRHQAMLARYQQQGSARINRKEAENGAR